MSIAVFMPAYNEGARVGASVEAALCIEGVDKVVVIDDGSTDDTRMQALLAGATVVGQPENVGKGGALMAALDDAHFDYGLFLDADLGETAAQGVLLLAPVVAGELDLAIARFPRPAKKTGFGKVKGLAAAAIAQADPAFDCQAPLSGQRAFTRACIDAVMPLAEGFGVEVAMTVRALQAGLRVGEIETQMSHVATGNDPAGILHRARQYRDVKRAIDTLAL